MKYDLKNKEEEDKAREYFESLVRQRCIVDITRKFNRRTFSQNNYLHLLLSYCALQYGETLEYFKQVIWKQIINRDIFEDQYVNRINGDIRTEWRSSADLDSKQMTLAIDRLLSWAPKELGIQLPTPNDTEYLRLVENEIERNRKYL